MDFCGIKRHKVRKAHCHAPRFTASAVEYDGHTITEALTVPRCLRHPFRKPDLLGSFDLDMYSRQSYKIGDITERHRAAALYGIPIFAENSGNFPFSVRAFAL